MKSYNNEDESVEGDDGVYVSAQCDKTFLKQGSIPTEWWVDEWVCTGPSCIESYETLRDAVVAKQDTTSVFAGYYNEGSAFNDEMDQQELQVYSPVFVGRGPSPPSEIEKEHNRIRIDSDPSAWSFTSLTNKFCEDSDSDASYNSGYDTYEDEGDANASYNSGYDTFEDEGEVVSELMCSY